MPLQSSLCNHALHAELCPQDRLTSWHLPGADDLCHHAQKHLFWLLSAILFMPLYIGCFSHKASTDADWHDVYVDIEKAIACVILFCFANVLTKVFSRMMSTHFHKEAHFSKMQDALRKVRTNRPSINMYFGRSSQNLQASLCIPPALMQELD